MCQTQSRHMRVILPCKKIINCSARRIAYTHKLSRHMWPSLLFRESFWYTAKGIFVPHALTNQNTSPTSLEKHPPHSCVATVCALNAIMRERHCAMADSYHLLFLWHVSSYYATFQEPKTDSFRKYLFPPPVAAWAIGGRVLNPNKALNTNHTPKTVPKA